ncbi:hypothetical protein, partial [Neisseria gonorrhoeae]|uniref:hypothetical protein n=1 Tax=Neisseria gonorrhoeae TaxID=485 RepID=UPI001C401975
RREEKRREEKRRFFAGWIHFRLLIRFDRLKKKIFTDVEGRIISGSGRCFNTIWRMNKNRYGVAPPRLKGNGSLKAPKHRADRFRTIRTACGPPPCPDFC